MSKNFPKMGAGGRAHRGRCSAGSILDKDVSPRTTTRMFGEMQEAVEWTWVKPAR